MKNEVRDLLVELIEDHDILREGVDDLQEDFDAQISNIAELINSPITNDLMVSLSNDEVLVSQELRLILDWYRVLQKERQQKVLDDLDVLKKRLQKMADSI